jgi:dTDP-D-glucose 4,6-dehydratase
MGKAKLKPIILNNSKQELNFQRLNYSKIQRELNWKPKTKFETGIKKTIDWYVKVYNLLKR